MVELIKIVGVAFLTAICGSLLKVTKPELSFAVTVTGVIIILLFIIDMMGHSLSLLSEIVEITGIENGLLRTLLKIVGVGYLVEFSAGLLNDFNVQAVADKVVLAGRLTIIAMSLPIIGGLLTLFKQFIALI